MITFTGRDIAEITDGRLTKDAPAGRICTDTRAVQPGDWFLAFVGERFDGHDFLATAIERGAVGVIVSREVEGISVGCVKVPDTLVAYQALGRHRRRELTVPVVGLTGSSGKTTTRALVACALHSLAPVHQTVANLNNHIGVPLTLLQTPNAAKVVVVEMGTSSPGEIEVLAHIAEPDVRMIVNVGPAHLLELGGLEGVRTEKGALFRTARPGDRCCVNIDDPHVALIKVPALAKAITWGLDPRATIRLVKSTLLPESLSTHAVFDTPQGRVEATIPAPGAHIAHNAAGALAVAHALGLDLKTAAKGLSRYEAVGMRMKAERTHAGALVLNDAYNANPASMKASLDVLAALPGRRVAVLGDMLELGPNEDDYHAEVAAHAGALGVELVVLVGRLMGTQGPCVAGAGEVWSFADPATALSELRRWVRGSDVLLVKGSRGARMEQVVQGLMEDPD